MPPVIVFRHPTKPGATAGLSSSATAQFAKPTLAVRQLGSLATLALAVVFCAALVSPSAGAQADAPTSAYAPRPSAQQSLPLRVASNGTNAGSQSQALHGDKRARKGSLTSITTAVSGLAIVLGLFFLVAWLFKRGMPKAAAALPREVVETLGRTMVAPRQTVHLIRIGQKLLLVSISATGVETLTEITDPLEVDRLAGICKQSAPSSASSAFRHVFQQFSHEPARAGFVGDDNSDNKKLASHELVPEVTDA